MRRPTTALAALALAGFVLGSCGDDEPSGSPEPTEAEPAEVLIERSRFDPKELTIAVGGEVTFENLDAFAHTATSAEGASVEYDSGTLEEGDTFRQRFDEAGSHGYFCEVHPTMRGTIVVE